MTDSDLTFRYWCGIAERVRNECCAYNVTAYDCAYIFEDLKNGANVFDIAATFRIGANAVRYIAILCGFTLSDCQVRRK